MARRVFPMIVALAAALVVVGPRFEAIDDEVAPLANLQVLPSDLSVAEVQPVMAAFVRSLSVSCTHCHSGQTATETDAYSMDGNPNKRAAREMLQMLADVHPQLGRTGRQRGATVEMWCESCHRGRPRPTGQAHQPSALMARSGSSHEPFV